MRLRLLDGSWWLAGDGLLLADIDIDKDSVVTVICMILPWVLWDFTFKTCAFWQSP